MLYVKNIILSSVMLLFTLILLPNSVYANEKKLVLNYDGFFDRMDDLDAPEYQDIKLAFYFMDENGKACPIKSVRLQTQLKKLDVYTLASGEVLLPFDHQLDADKAAIVIEKLDNKPCGLDMRLETSILLDNNVEVNKAKSLISTFDLALNDLAGMMSFTLPDVVGITFRTKPEHTLTINNMVAGQCKLNSCTLTLADLVSYPKGINFSHSLVKAVPFIN